MSWFCFQNWWIRSASVLSFTSEFQISPTSTANHKPVYHPAMSSHHTHKRIKNLSIGRHYATDLAKFVEMNASCRNPVDMSSRQRRAYRDFKDGLNYPIYSDSNRQNYPEGDIINTYFGFFDIMFFGGARKLARVYIPSPLRCF